MSRYKFISGCPACGNRELNNWTHSKCGGEEEIDENGDIYCLKCKEKVGFILDIRFKCDLHDFKEITDVAALFQGLAMLIDSNRNIPVDFAKNISEKLLKNLYNK